MDVTSEARAQEEQAGHTVIDVAIPITYVMNTQDNGWPQELLISYLANVEQLIIDWKNVCVYLVVRDSDGKDYEDWFPLLTDEGHDWIRGHHAPDSEAVAALKVAHALGRAV